MDEQLRKLLANMKTREASDLHLTVGVPPQYRIYGSLEPLDMDPLKPEDVERMVLSMLNKRQRQTLESDKELDCSVGIAGQGRYRVNVFFQRNSLATAIRRLPYEIPDFEELGLPPAIMRRLSEANRGMVLVTGPTGSGKSTTLAAMINHVNRNFRKHVVCVEDPIEYLHSHNKSVVNQREVGQDTLEFSKALRHILRQDPDVVQIGEMRDLETIKAMLTVAETGHLALSTLHTNDAVSTINRIIDVFPYEQQEQIRIQLSFVLEAVIAQQLVPRKDNDGLVLAYEIMVANPAVRNLIREKEVDQIYSQIQMGKGAGMKTINASLAELVRMGKISEITARSRCTNAKELESLLKNS
jgi:twitching motility protein PilT